MLFYFRNLFMLAERFETDVVNQFANNIDKEALQSDNTRITMGNIYENVLFFLNHLTRSFIDYSRSESPQSASYVESVNSGPSTNTGTLQRFRIMEQQNRRWSEAAAIENPETNIDNNRRWSMPTNVNSKTQSRFMPMMNKLAGLLKSQQSQSTIPDYSVHHSSVTSKDGVIEAIQLLSFRPPVYLQRPPQQPFGQQQPHFRTQQQARPRQQQSRGELTENILLRDSLTNWPQRYQQIAENIRGESDEY